MRIINKNIKLSKLIQHPVMLFLIVSGLLYFTYLNFYTIKYALKLYDRKVEAENTYNQAKIENQKAQITDIENSSQEASDRYRKEFFNELQEGEYVVFLHKEKAVKSEEEVRKLSWLEKVTQSINLWWKNL